jgi:hypothetical protein
MVVEHLTPAVINDLVDRVAGAGKRASVSESRQHDDSGYWQELFEANAAALLSAFGRMRPTDPVTRALPLLRRRGADSCAVRVARRRGYERHAAPA